jgi:hypothetical protein
MEKWTGQKLLQGVSEASTLTLYRCCLHKGQASRSRALWPLGRSKVDESWDDPRWSPPGNCDKWPQRQESWRL